MSADNHTVCPKCEATFREFYELGIHEGEFFVDYEGVCRDCDFTYKFNLGPVRVS